MQRTLIAVAASLAFVMSGAVWAEQTPGYGANSSSGSAMSATAAPTTAPSNQQAPLGYVLVDQRIIYLMANEPQQHFVNALSRLGQKDFHAASAELRMASGYLQMQSSRANPQNQQTLHRAAVDLSNLASRVASGNVPQVSQLNTTFARANLALSNHFQSMANSDLDQRQYVQAGHELRSAAQTLRQAIVWSNQQPTQQEVALVHQAEQVATSLIGKDVYNPNQSVAAANQLSQNEAQQIKQQAQDVTQKLNSQLRQLASNINQSQAQPAAAQEQPSAQQPGQSNQQQPSAQQGAEQPGQSGYQSPTQTPSQSEGQGQ